MNRLAYGLILLAWLYSLVAHAEPYRKQAGVAGQLIAVGSDSMANLMALWSAQFNEYYPHVKVQIQASGSSTAPPALSEGTANIGAMSRELKYNEINQFTRRHGYPPLALKVAVDAIAIFVQHDNPLTGVSIEQIDRIFSVTRFCAGGQPLLFWHQLDSASWQLKQPIVVFGRNSISGTYGQFKRRALCDGDFRASVRELPGSASVVQSIAATRGAIGYAAFGHKTAGVRALAVADKNNHYIPVTAQTIESGRYPLTRYLYLVVNKKPGQPLPSLEKAFLRFVLSYSGQRLVDQDGYFALPDKLAFQQKQIIN